MGKRWRVEREREKGGGNWIEVLVEEEYKLRPGNVLMNGKNSKEHAEVGKMQ